MIAFFFCFLVSFSFHAVADNPLDRMLVEGPHLKGIKLNTYADEMQSYLKAKKKDPKTSQKKIKEIGQQIALSLQPKLNALGVAKDSPQVTILEVQALRVFYPLRARNKKSLRMLATNLEYTTKDEKFQPKPPSFYDLELPVPELEAFVLCARLQNQIRTKEQKQVVDQRANAVMNAIGGSIIEQLKLRKNALKRVSPSLNDGGTMHLTFEIEKDKSIKFSINPRANRQGKVYAFTFRILEEVK